MEADDQYLQDLVDSVDTVLLKNNNHWYVRWYPLMSFAPPFLDSHLTFIFTRAPAPKPILPDQQVSGDDSGRRYN